MSLPAAPLPALGSVAEAVPHARLLSNGRWTTLVTGAGTGYASCGGVQLTAWRGDRVEDADGVFLFLHDLDAGATWPIGRGGASGEAAAYRPGVMRFDGEVAGLSFEIEIVVAADTDVELRRIRLHERAGHRRRLALTAYAAIVLHDPAAHAAHPAFAKLFVETRADEESGVVRARRRPRGPSAAVPPLLGAALFGPGVLAWETSRARFLGRGRTAATACGLDASVPLGNGTGSVLDPVFAFRRTFELTAGEEAEWTLVLCCTRDGGAVTSLAARYAEPGAAAAAAAGAEARASRVLADARLSAAAGEYLHELAGGMLYGDPALRAPDAVFERVHGGVPDVGGQGLASSRPIVVLDARRAAGARAVPELGGALDYWRAHGLAVDARIVCTRAATLAAETPERDDLRFIEAPKVDARALGVVRALARLDFAGRWPTPRRARRRAARRAAPLAVSFSRALPPAEPRGRLAYNGYGGFWADGREYVIDVPAAAGERPPMPWCNVIANERFGCLVSESGAGCTWSRNSREHRLTPWSNDPVTDPHGEALYVRDEESGAFWSPQPGPAGGDGRYEVAHGFGYSRWRHERDGIAHEVDTFVAADDPVRFVRVRLENRGARPRRLSVWRYARLVLGVSPEEVGHAVVTAHDDASGTLLATSGLRGEFNGGVAFAAAAGPPASVLHAGADRAAFLGRGGSPAAPAALATAGPFAGGAGARLDPCFVHAVVLDVAPAAAVECVFVIGEGATRDEALALARRHLAAGAATRALALVHTTWEDTLGAVRIRTPVPAIDLVANGWLAYQTLACRVWGRTAFYQSGGAFGFRDQLQDVSALVWARPGLTRSQILLHAAHQFVEGDVLHWWHPPADRGTRTRFSDDLLWLGYVTAGYVAATGDAAVLDEVVPFAAAPSLAPGEDETMVEARTAGETAPVYEHCCRAIDRSLTRGAHGLPLMGTGDWNDGMNLVGRQGRGESVWMGFFLDAILGDFIPLCEARGDVARAARYRAYRSDLRPALEGAWDGAWYRRAWFDDGAPLGTADDDECRIDVLPQAWAVMTGAVARARQETAMDSVERELLLDPPGMIRLLAPPFDRTPKEPGYIKGYVPGIRENGGQYTHGALWAVRATAELGRRDRAAAWLEMLSPVRHARSAETAAVYQVEPYVVAADVYSAPAHRGRGGWTWYTGSAAWMLRVTVESVLGCTLEGGRWLRVRPCIPDAWPGFRLTYRLPDRRTVYEVAVENPHGCSEAVSAATLDGAPCAIDGGAARLPLAADGRTHQAVVRLGPATAAPPASNT